MRKIVANGDARLAATTHLGYRIEGYGSNPPGCGRGWATERSFAADLVGHARPIAPARREDVIHVDAEVVRDLFHDGIHELHVVVSGGPSASAISRTISGTRGATSLHSVGRREDRRIVREGRQTVVVLGVDRLVVAIERVDPEDELVRLGVVVAGRDLQDVPALRAVDRNRDRVAVVG